MQEAAAGTRSLEQHELRRQLSLRDLVLTQALTVVGSAWVGIAAGVGRAQFVVWLMALLFTGATRLPMTAGWDHLIPEWFTRLHPRFRTPTNSILVTSGVVALLLILGSAGVRAAEAFGLLNDASSEFYALAYLAMFLIPICGSKTLRARLPRWVAGVCAGGVLAMAFVLVMNAYPFVDVKSPAQFAAKIIGTVILVNACGYGFYRSRRGR